MANQPEVSIDLDEKFEEVSQEVEVEAVEVEEETSAQASVKMPGKSSKSQMLGDLMKHVAGMTKQDLSSFLDKTLAQVGNENAPDTSAKNQASIKQGGAGTPSPSAKAMKEDIDSMFEGDEAFSEEFKTSASTIFEAAVNNRVMLIQADLEEQFEEKLEEQVNQSIDELQEQVNTYMDYVVEKWMEQNEVALENNFRVEATEKFIDGLKGLFAESYVEVPEEKVDMVADLEAQIKGLEEQVEEATRQNVQLSAELSSASMKEAFDSVSEGMVDTAAEKLRSLAEGVEFTSAAEYAEKLAIIKKQYFAESVEESVETGLINEEDSVALNEEQDEAPKVPVEMRSYTDAISRTIKR